MFGRTRPSQKSSYAFLVSIETFKTLVIKEFIERKGISNKFLNEISEMSHIINVQIII